MYPITIARIWKQPRCPSTDEWIKKLWYTYTAIKKNAFESVLMNLEFIIQSEMSQKEKEYCNLMYVYEIQKNGTEEFMQRATREKQIQKIDLWTWGKWRRG